MQVCLQGHIKDVSCSAVLLSFPAEVRIALRIDDVSVHVCPQLPFSFAIPKKENGSFEIL